MTAAMDKWRIDGAGAQDASDRHRNDHGADVVLLRRGHRARWNLPLHRILPVVDGLAVGIGLVPVRERTLAALYWLLTVLVLAASGAYRPRIAVRFSDDLPRIFGGVSVPLLVMAVLAVPQPAAAGLVASIPAVLTTVVLARAASALAVKALRTRGFWAEPTLIIGAGDVGVHIARTLIEHREYGLQPVGFLDDPYDRLLPIPILGGLQDFDAVLTEHAVSRVIVAFGSAREPDMVQILRTCQRGDLDVYVVSRLYDLGVVPEGGRMECLGGTPLLHVHRAALTPSGRRAKRCFDVVVSAMALVVTMPLFGMIAIAVRCGSPGPAFFRQKRVGQGGRVIEILKFRTLPVNANSDTTWSVAGDPRITRIGRLLRSTSLDELPQLINVLRGDMSLVGPRPERPMFVDQFAVSYPQYLDRHRLPVGMTGWAQVHGLRGDTSITDRVRFDNYYIEHWSLWMDITILIRSLWAVIRGFR